MRSNIALGTDILFESRFIHKVLSRRAGGYCRTFQDHNIARQLAKGDNTIHLERMVCFFGLWLEGEHSVHSPYSDAQATPFPTSQPAKDSRAVAKNSCWCFCGDLLVVLRTRIEMLDHLGFSVFYPIRCTGIICGWWRGARTPQLPLFTWLVPSE